MLRLLDIPNGDIMVTAVQCVILNWLLAMVSILLVLANILFEEL